MSNEIRYDLSRRFVQASEAIYAYDAGGAIALGGVLTDITFDTEVYKSSNYFSFTAGNAPITILVAGWYEVSYYIGTEKPSGSIRSTSAAGLAVDTGGGFAVIGGTQGLMYNRQSPEGHNSASVSILHQFSANDIVKLQAQITNGSNVQTVANACGILIKSFVFD